jgi:hypothetical protein
MAGGGDTFEDRPPRSSARPPRYRDNAEGGEAAPRREYSTKGEREHDRRSRGRPGSESRGGAKKEGGGSHNWGTPADEMYVVDHVPCAGWDGAFVAVQSQCTGRWLLSKGHVSCVFFALCSFVATGLGG